MSAGSPSPQALGGKRRALGLALLFGGLLVGLLLAELASRAMRGAADDTSRVRVPDRFLHHAFRPFATGAVPWAGHTPIYHINSLGYRDRSSREVSRSTLEDGRVLLLGDSFVEGLGVSYALTVAHQLEQLLTDNGQAYEVLNGAVASYSPFLHYRRLRRFFELGYRTTDVVVFVDVSDVQDEATAGFERLGEDDPFRSESWQSLLNVIRRSHVVRQFWETAPFSSLAQRDDYYAVRDRWTEDDQLFEQYGKIGIERCQELLLRIRNLASSHRARLQIVIYPWPTQLVSKRVPSRAETVFQDFAARHDISLINAFPAFRMLPDWRSHFIAGDSHWNADGHRLMAELVASSLERYRTAGLPRALPGEPTSRNVSDTSSP
jgi:hypothetical protein